MRELFASRGSYNVFHDVYHELVHALASYGVSANLYCVDIDAFLYGRLGGEAVEIEDHLTRGRNMDTRTPASRCRYRA
ncbi:hypothetical protein [Thiocystis violacea]|uniref:hypothetical protein n=1 Tax=Thiocystis violacea TaxID=13725 RepID=UPI001F5BF415|nr:hypothetical protein [Thiocystis violacea]